MKKRLIKASLAFVITAFSGIDIRALAEKYPMQITAERKNKIAYLRITGTLFEWNNSAEEITRKIDGFLEDGINDVEVYVNSPGGDVFVAAEIINQINRFSGSKKGIGGAVVASAATMIAIELDTFEMAENGQFMYHKPSGYLNGNEDKIEAGLKLLKNLSSQYKAKYALKTGKTEQEIEEAWAKGDVWLTAHEAVAQKFITGVISKTKITPEASALFAACGAPTIPEPEDETFKNLDINMKNRDQIVAALKLPADATDEQIQTAVTAAMKKAGEVDTVVAQAASDKKQHIEEFVDGMILAKKATADQKENLIAMGNANFDSLKAFANSLPVLEKPTPTPTSENDVRANWTLADYLEKDPAALEVLATKDPEKFTALNTAHYGTVIK